MAKLYFRYGVMGSGKSTQLIQIAHDYRVNNGLEVMVCKPNIDTKGNDRIVSRLGNEIECDYLIESNKSMYCEFVFQQIEFPDVILVDESQFLSKFNVKDLAKIAVKLDIPVICFGLKVDFTGSPFEGSSWLFALANDIEEISTRALSQHGDRTKRGTMNLRLVNGKPVFEGDTVAIDGKDDVTYKPITLNEFIKLNQNY